MDHPPLLESTQMISSSQEDENIQNDEWSKKNLVGLINEQAFFKAVLNISQVTKDERINLFRRKKTRLSKDADAWSESNDVDESVNTAALLETLTVIKEKKFHEEKTEEVQTFWSQNQLLLNKALTQPKKSPTGRLETMFPHLTKSIENLDFTIVKFECVVDKITFLESRLIFIKKSRKQLQFDCWIPTNTNIISNDSDYLTHWPYLEQKNELFEHQLYKNYQCQIHCKYHSELSNERLFQLVHLTKCLMDSKSENFYPSYKVFHKIATDLNARTVEISKRYLEACKEMFPEDTTRQLDSDYEVVSSRFCIRCGVYTCLSHDERDDTQGDIENTKRRGCTKVDIPKCLNLDCVCELDVRDNIELLNSEHLDSWSQFEKIVHKSLSESFENWYCAAAAVSGTKTCREFQSYDFSVTKNEMGDKIIKKQWRKQEFKSENRRQTQWLRHYKSYLEADDENKAIVTRYTPCRHPTEICSIENSNCFCYFYKTGCDKYCNCPLTCINRYPGCKCKTTCLTKSCPCRSLGRECDPDLCDTCQHSDNSTNERTCRNDGLLRRSNKCIKIGVSAVHGYGAFVMEPVLKGEFITEYCGEKISHEEGERRGYLYDQKQHTFLFNLNDEFALDASVLGSKARYINSSAAPNCNPNSMLVNGDHRIAIYALRDIDAKEELFMNYNHVLMQHKVGNKADGGA